MRRRFGDRDDAGQQLADALGGYAHRSDVLAVGLPRGGVVVAARVAARLGVPLDVVVVRKIRTPGHAELAMGALALWHEQPEIVREDEVLAAHLIPDEVFQQAVAAELAEARDRASRWAGRRPALEGRTVLVVDDGLATGSTMRAALQVLRTAGAHRVVVAVPVAAPDRVQAFRRIADDVVCVHQPEPMYAVGVHYADFREVPDDVVDHELRRGAGRI